MKNVRTTISLKDPSAERLVERHAEGLTDRQQELLRLIIQHYVLTANPVGSRYLARVSSLGLSDASTRNIMADLEFMGYIDHPHTSAGRTPTDKGYRAYVNSLMPIEKVTGAERKAVARSFIDVVTPEEVLAQASNLLAKLSKQLSLVLLPALDQGVLERVEIAQLSSNRVLIILSVSTGRVRTVTFETHIALSQQQLERLRTILNERLAGLNFQEIRASFSARLQDIPDEEKSVLRIFLDSPERLFDDNSAERVRLSGAQNIFSQPEFQKKGSASDTEFRSIIELLEDEEVVIHVLERARLGLASQTSDSHLAIRIGSELADEKMANYSVISTRYKIGAQTGTIGLIGPKRMEYARMAPLVEYVARAMSNALPGS